MITLLVITVSLAVLGVLFGKRFGVLVLALAAGLLVSQSEAAPLVAVSAPYIHQYTAYVPAALVVLPSIMLLLFVKGRHRKVVPRILSAVVYGFAGLVFVLASPATPVSLSGNFTLLTQNLGLILSTLIGVAVLEVAFGKASKKKLPDEPKK